MNVIVSNKYESLLSGLNIDVIKSINGIFSVEDLVSQFKTFYFNKMVLDITALERYEDINTIQKLSVSMDMSKIILVLDDSPKVNSQMYLSQLVSMGIYNFTKQISQIPFLIDNSNTYKDVAEYHQLNMNFNSNLGASSKYSNDGFMGQRIIGIRNLTDHAGSTTLCYILRNHLQRLYKAVAVETDRKDFAFLPDKKLESISSLNLVNFIQSNVGVEVIIVDVHTNDVENLCNDMIYLVEPGLIQLNRLIEEDPMVFENLKGRKIVLNKSVLSSSDVSVFEKEARCRVFFNIPPLDDKDNDIKVVNEFLSSLGFTRFSEDSVKKGGFNLFH